MAQANNSFVISGNLVRDPEIKLTTKQTKYSFVSLAVRGMAKDKVDFLTVCFWEKLADNIKQYCHKGDTLTICGHITTFKKDEKTQLQLVADGFTILASKKPAESPAPEEPAEAVTEKPNPAKAVYGDVFSQVTDPFSPF